MTSERFEEKEVEGEVDMEPPAEPQAFHCTRGIRRLHVGMV